MPKRAPSSKFHRQRDLKAREREARAAKLANEGATLKEIAEAVGYADHSGARRAIARIEAKLIDDAKQSLEDKRRKLDRRMEGLHWRLMQIIDDVDADAETKLDAIAKAMRGVDIHARVTGVVKVAPAAVVTVTQTTNTIDTGKFTASELAAYHTLRSKAAGLPAPLAAPAGVTVSQNVTTNVVEKTDTIA